VQIPLPIETARLLIRPFDPDRDSGEMLAVYGDGEVMRYIPGGALSNIEAVRAALEDHVRVQLARGFSSWALVNRQSEHVIGDVGFSIFEPTGDVELGYTLAKGAWGAGYATEAAAACLSAGLASLFVPRIIAVVDEANERSQRVAERIGMAKIRTIRAYGRPHLLYGVRGSRRTEADDA
jgi:RimJ/RimL family protein N-acetyltransferase